MADVKKKRDKERKDCLITIRMTDNDVDIVNYLSEYMGKSISDTISRACKFYLNADDSYEDIDKFSDVKEEERKNRRIHLRMSSSDVNILTEKGDKRGDTISQTIRKAIKMYHRVRKKSY